MPPRIFRSAADLGETAAALILERYRSRRPGRRFLLGCPGGRSGQSTYRALHRQAGGARLDLSDLVVVMMDEYLVPASGGRLVPVDPATAHSCRRFGSTQILGRINQALARAGLPESHAVPDDQLWLPDPDGPAAYDTRIAAAGGIDVFLLASGASDGHVAFNTPGADRDSRTRVVELPESTRRDNLATFPSFGQDLTAVPGHGVTVGVATIREQSAEVIMIVQGVDKRVAVRRLAAAESYEPDWPATVLSECRSPHLFVDTAAAAAPALPATA